MGGAELDIRYEDINTKELQHVYRKVTIWYRQYPGVAYVAGILERYEKDGWQFMWQDNRRIVTSSEHMTTLVFRKPK